MNPIVLSAILIELGKVIRVKTERQKDWKRERFNICHVLSNERYIW